MNPYYEQTILNADPIELVRILYQRAISCVWDAREHLRHKRIAQRSAAIMRAYAVFAELIAALRHEATPELSGRLQSLYFYMQQRLLDANAHQVDLPLAEVLALLTTLEEGWSGVAEQLAPGKEMTNAIEDSPSSENSCYQWHQGESAGEDTSRLAVRA